MSRAGWLDRFFRRSHYVSSRHAAEIDLKAFEKVFDEPVEAVIERVKLRI
ncbi:MAG: hypothetical protein QW791_06180 [Candidatus Bathyarchaeia archaeon]